MNENIIRIKESNKKNFKINLMRIVLTALLHLNLQMQMKAKLFTNKYK